MLTRRHLRIKVMQSLYSFLHNRESNLAKEVDFFKKSYLNTFSLYLALMAFLKSIYDYALDQTSLQKGLRINSNPFDSKSLVENKILHFIANHPVLNQYIKKRKIKFWELDFEYVKSNFKDLMQSEKYQEYSRQVSPSIEDDRAIIVFFFKEILAPSDDFYDYLEDKELTWIDDLPVVNTFLLKILQRIDPHDSKSLYFPEMITTEEDPQFAIALLEKVVANNDSLQQEMVGRTPNWDSDRIALLDAIMIKMAMAELLFFPTIPPKVTMNEYIEISKDYSTPKSNIFINGILDQTIRDFDQSGRLNKTGRGLN
ncbi:MAG: transcription antitermination protein NusB [Flavobacteriaceae bacterium]